MTADTNLTCPSCGNTWWELRSSEPRDLYTPNGFQRSVPAPARVVVDAEDRAVVGYAGTLFCGECGQPAPGHDEPGFVVGEQP